ncbi:hypothetical protein [Streptomyces sp. NPDC088923]|uniref:hypothetical protein n=1 Tax=Streptomyces sp. NPDC088923 TaxID=3365913 RepID=UPI0038190C95
MALLTLEEACAQINLAAPSEAQRAELTAYIESVTPVIEGHVGAVEPREVTQTIEGRGPTLALLTVPVLELVSLTPLDGGPGLDVARLHVDGPSGIVRRLGGGAWFGRGPWTATYRAGRPDIPATINLAARLLVQHLWRTQLRSSPGLAGGGDDYSVTEPVPGMGYAVPNRVLQLLEPFKVGPGVA